MELVSVSIAGWRRLKEKQTLQTNGKIVSILGPNEAGKSSLLDAIHFLRSHEDASNSDVARGATREAIDIIGYYSLSDEEVAHAGLASSTRLVLRKRADGAGTFTLDPPAPKRDISARKALCAQIRRCLQNSTFTSILSDEVEEQLDSLAYQIDTDNEDISSEDIPSLKDISTKLGNLNLQKYPKYISELSENMSSLYDAEKAPNPGKKANKYLQSRIPVVLYFDDDQRDLRQDYSFDEIASAVPAALANLASIANLNIPNLIEAVNNADVAEFESIKAIANANLRKRFAETWSQSGVHVSFAIRDRILSVVIENEPNRFTNLAERSEGFRQFVALQTFTMKQRINRPILLIDEAELHLHYDAQADLIQMLARQDVAAKVIYTTHSAGCLPEDLGNGVRLVSRANAVESKIINRFWGSTEIGFSPLLVGMGASTLAFFPTRRALMVEGEGEMLLLPTLFRQALNRSVLGFQVVPGLAKANKALLPSGGIGNRHVAFLVDGDGGGRAISKELRQNGVSDEAIFSLSTAMNAECSLEDFLEQGLLLEAVNNVIKKFSPGSQPIKKLIIGPTGKFSATSEAFEKHTGKRLMKVDLAYEVLDLSSVDPKRRILDPLHAASLHAVGLAIDVFFGAGVADGQHANGDG